MLDEFRILRPISLKPKPDKYEEKVAELLAIKFQSDVEFVVRGLNTTPDVLVARTGQFWEIKNIKGNGKHAVENNLRQASKQSKNVIISLLKPSKLDSSRVESKIRYVLQSSNIKIEHVLLITKAGKVIDIK